MLSGLGVQVYQGSNCASVNWVIIFWQKETKKKEVLKKKELENFSLCSIVIGNATVAKKLQSCLGGAKRNF